MIKTGATNKKKGTAGIAEDNDDRELIKVEDTIAKMLDAADVNKVYGTPIEKGDAIIIPVAEVKSGMGLGGGFGTGMVHQEDSEAEAEEGSGGGGGGGGHVQSRPVAVVVASNGSVRVEPVIDKTRIALTAILANGILGFMLLRLLRKR